MKSQAITLLSLLLGVTGCATRPQVSGRILLQLDIANDRRLDQAHEHCIQEGEPIPRQYTCNGVNVSPSLGWSGVPKSAKTVVIIADDPDAPAGTWCIGYSTIFPRTISAWLKTCG